MRLGWNWTYFRGVVIERVVVELCVVLWRWTWGGDIDVERTYVELQDTARDVISERWVCVSVIVRGVR